MNYKLKEKPQEVYWSTTKQFTIVDEEGREYEIRIGDSSKTIEWFMWHEPGGWDEIIDVSILDYLENNFPDDESDFEEIERKEEEKKMDEVMEKFVQENGEIKEVKQFDDLVSEMMKVQDYTKTFYERSYLAVHRAKKLLGK